MEPPPAAAQAGTDLLPPIPPILLEGDPVPPVPRSGPGGRFVALPPVGPTGPGTPEGTSTAPEPEWEELGDYAVGRLWLAARDPFTLHATWDLTPDQLAQAGETLALRLYAGREPTGPFRQIMPGPRSRSVFIPVERPAQWYVAEIGFCPALSGWRAFAVSTPIQTPAVRPQEAAETAFVMLSLPPEPPSVGQPKEPVSEPAAPPPALAETQPASPASPASPAISPPPAGTGAGEAAPLPTLPPPETSRPVPVTPALPAEPAAPTFTPVLAGPAPAAPPPAETPHERAAKVLQRVPEPPWTPAQARAMAAEFVRLERGAPPGSLAGAVVPGPGWPVAAAAPELPASGEWLRGPELGPTPPVPLPSSAEVSRPSGPTPPRRFWFNIHTELIVYGATEPDARVTVDGEPVPLRPDGSFTLRFSLPDGEYALRAVATAADGAESRAARLEFVRHTTYRGRVEAAPADPALHPPAARTSTD